jgi:hypothetical protein
MPRDEDQGTRHAERIGTAVCIVNVPKTPGLIDFVCFISGLWQDFTFAEVGLSPGSCLNLDVSSGAEDTRI